MKPEASQAAVGAIATLQARIRELEDENEILAREYEKLKQTRETKKRINKEKIRLLEEEVMRKVEEAEKAKKEADNANDQIQLELERKDDLLAQIAEVEEELQNFHSQKKSRSCPPSPNISSSTSSKNLRTPQKGSKSSIRSSIAETQFKLNEYEDLLSYIFAPPEITPHLTPREEEIVSMIYNNTFDDFVKLQKENEKPKSKKHKHSKKRDRSEHTNTFIDNDYFDDDIQYQNERTQTDDLLLNSRHTTNSYQTPGSRISFGADDQFTEDKDQLFNDSNFDYDFQLDNDDQLEIYDNHNSDEHFDFNSETDDTVDELFVTLPDSFNEVFRNYLPRRIFKTVMWLKQLPKKFRKQSIPMKRRIITVLRVARHETSLLSARIAFLERRKFASSSPKRFNTEIHRYEVQLLILANEMKRFRF